MLLKGEWRVKPLEFVFNFVLFLFRAIAYQLFFFE